MVKSTRATEALRAAVRDVEKIEGQTDAATAPARPETEEAVVQKTSLKDNHFHKIFTDPALDTPEKKKEACEALLKADATKDEKANNKLMGELTAYMEMLQKTLESMGLKQVETSSFETIALLQAVTDEILGDLSELKSSLKPFTDAIAVIQNLREANRQIDLIESVRQDKKADAIRAEKRAARDKALADLQQKIKDKIKEKEITEGSAGKVDKLLSGWVTTGYKTKLATLDSEITDIKEEISKVNKEIQDEVAEIEAREKVAENDTHFNSKRAIRGLLDIGDEDIKQQHDLIKQRAIRFIKNSSSRVTEVIDQLDIVKNRIQQLSDTNGKVGAVFTVLNEALDSGMRYQAGELDKLLQLDGKEPAEGQTQKMLRDRSKGRIERFIGELKGNLQLSVTSRTEINQNDVAIANMTRNNNETINNAKEMRSRSISAAAMRTTVTLDTVSHAAGREALGIVNTALDDWDGFTGKVLKDALGQTVLNERDSNKRLLMMIDRLADLTTTVNDTTDGISKSTKITFALLDQMGISAEELKTKVEELKGVDATSHRAYAANPEAVLQEGASEAEALREPRSNFKKAANDSKPQGGGSMGFDTDGINMAPVFAAPVYAPNFH